MIAVKQFVKNPNYFKEQKSDLADWFVDLITKQKAPWSKKHRPNPNERYIPIKRVNWCKISVKM